MFIALAAFCAAQQPRPAVVASNSIARVDVRARARAITSTQRDPFIDPLVDGAWLRDQLAKEDRLIVLDVRPEPEYAAGHIPGSRRIDLEATFSDTSSDLKWQLPPADEFEQAMRAAGVSDSSRVVVAGQPPWNTRAWWTLRAYGHEETAVLDGGFEAWAEQLGPVEEGGGRAAPRAGDFTAVREPRWTIDRAELARELGSLQVVDARDTQAYARSHIPGARSLPAASLHAPGRFLDPLPLLERAGVDPSLPTAVYCQTGAMASVATFALWRAGAHDVRLYDGSWEEWSALEGVSMEAGSGRQ